MLLIPEEKAKEIFGFYRKILTDTDSCGGKREAKKCAYREVEEIIEAIKYFYNGNQSNLEETMGYQYWEKVKNYIKTNL